ncbi:MAG: YegS/Rv2252/BmrU family lipid kinase [Clostridia bacterium]|nr:YegS/Rv2252/BmrU family lipid kinase [Clostridia bacterium]
MMDGMIEVTKKEGGKNLLFIYNPKAGKGKIKKHLFDIIDIFSHAEYALTVSPTKCPGDACNIVKQCDKNFYDLIVCSGGDGTLNDVVAGMAQSEKKIPIGYIPAGSTNDFARSLGLSNDMVTAAKDILKGNVFSYDVGRFNDQAFVYIAAFGLFTEVSYATDQNLKNTLGHMAYILKGARSLPSIKAYHISIESKEFSAEGNFIYGMITNSYSVGGFKNITGKDIKLDDGEFEVTLIRRPSCLSELNSIVTSLLTHRMDSSCIYTFKTSQLKVKSKEEICWTLDGEFGGAHKAVLIHNEQKKLSFLVNTVVNK